MGKLKDALDGLKTAISTQDNNKVKNAIEAAANVMRKVLSPKVSSVSVEKPEKEATELSERFSEQSENLSKKDFEQYANIAVFLKKQQDQASLQCLNLFNRTGEKIARSEMQDEMKEVGKEFIKQVEGFEQQFNKGDLTKAQIHNEIIQAAKSTIASINDVYKLHVLQTFLASKEGDILREQHGAKKKFSSLFGGVLKHLPEKIGKKAEGYLKTTGRWDAINEIINSKINTLSFKARLPTSVEALKTPELKKS